MTGVDNYRLSSKYASQLLADPQNPVLPVNTRNLAACYLEVVAANAKLREGLENMIGMFDNPVRRRLMPGSMNDEACDSGRNALLETADIAIEIAACNGSVD